MKPKRRCRYCQSVFAPSIYHPSQQVCSSVGCQRIRRREDRLRRYRSDPTYRQVCLDSNWKWRERNAGYQSRYRQSHPDYVERNRKAQSDRDHRRQLGHLVKNNLAFEVEPRPKRVWLVGPDFEPLVKNNLAFSQVVIFQDVAAVQAPSPGIL